MANGQRQLTRVLPLSLQRPPGLDTVVMLVWNRHSLSYFTKYLLYQEMVTGACNLFVLLLLAIKVTEPF